MKTFIPSLFLIFSWSILAQEIDTCKTWQIEGKNIYELSKMDKINCNRITNMMTKIVDKKCVIELLESKDYLVFISSEIKSYFEQYSEIVMDNYVIQTIFLKQNNKKYCISIFQEMENDGNECLAKRVLSQNGGGNSFIYIIFDLDQFSLMKVHVNGW